MSAIVAAALSDLADLADIRGAAIEAGDLRRAAAVIDALGPSAAARLIQRARRDHFTQEPGISPTVHWRLRELALGGIDEALRAARAGVPFFIRRLLELPALAPREALTLVRQTGVLTLLDLSAPQGDGRVRTAVGDLAAERLRSAAAALELELRPLTLGRAWDFLEPLLAAIPDTCPAIDLLVPSGDVRRFEPLVHALVVVGRAVDPPAAIETLCGMRTVNDVLHRSARRAILLVDEMEVDIRIAAPDEYGTVLFATTGARAHVEAVQARRGRGTLAGTEQEVYAHVGLSFITAELRHGSGEIEAAQSGRLPALVARDDIRGDLHMHSTYSDGRDSIEGMAAQSLALGYEYIAITDHSERAGASRTLAVDQIRIQRDEIERVRARFPSLAILHGIEVEILPDGRLDFDDEVLEQFEIVLASLHESARQDAATLTRRCIRAVRHPLVTILTHPTNRLVGRRSGYPLDFAAVYAAAVECGTALEIDGAPGHLDLDGEHARAAVAAGVTVTIDSDCHRARSLDRQMRFGIGTARRGWVEPGHVLNTRPLAGVRAFIATKRGKR